VILNFLESLELKYVLSQRRGLSFPSFINIHLSRSLYKTEMMKLDLIQLPPFFSKEQNP